MNIKIVNSIMQNKDTKSEYRQFDDETWSVEEYYFCESNGGILLWINKMLELNPKIIYLYSIKTINTEICNGLTNTINEIIHCIRFDVKM